MIKYFSLLKIIFLSIFIFTNIFAQTNADELKNEALSEMKDGRYGEAIDLLNKYISAKPQQAQGYNLRGLCYEKRSQFELAVYDFRSARKLEPKNSEINSNLKRTTNAWYSILYNNIEGYRREIEINPNNAENYLQVGKAFKNLGEWLTAEDWYDKYLSREEPSADEIIRYTEILAKNNHIKKGEPILKKYSDKYHGDHRIWSRFGYFEMWLGKKHNALNAFEHALELRPFFKEAMDGLDRVKGKGYIYTVNDTSSRYRKYYGTYFPNKKFVYPIDKYYKILKTDSSNNEIRVSLINELMKANRMEEAYNQLQILLSDNEDSKYDSLSNAVISFRKNYYDEKIKALENNLLKNPSDKKSIEKLGEYYAITKQHDKAIKMYQDYLLLKPNDLEMHFKLAKNYAYNKDFKHALEQTNILIDKSPDSIKYKLLNAQLSVWLNRNLDEAEKDLLFILNKDPNNFQALITMGALKFQMKEYESARNYASLAEKISTDNFDLNRLKYMLDLQVKRDSEATLFNKLEKARELAFKEKCEEAITNYAEYISESKKENILLDKQIALEMANAYVCAKKYSSAIAIYDSLLKNSYDYEIDKQRGKVYFWSSDSVKALIHLKELASKNPDDAEIKLMLGDAYVQNNQPESARKIYEEMLSKAPSSFIIKQRLGWLNSASNNGSFPNYILLSPEYNLFTDNQSFLYNLRGVKLEIGVTKFLSIAGSVFNGSFNSDSVSKNLYLNIIKGHLYLRFASVFTFSSAYGRTFFNDTNSREIFQASLKAEKKDEYLFNAEYNSIDAAQLLYSSQLINNRLKADQYSFEGEYKNLNQIILSGRYSYVYVYDKNSGNDFEFKLGKEIFSDLVLGYEYHFENYKKVSAFYYSPKNFESHSLWGDVQIIKNENTNISVGAKVGLITQTNFVLREAHGTADYKILENLTIQANITAGSTIRNNDGYSSLSFFTGIYWGI